VNLEKTKIILMSHCKKAGQMYSIMIRNRFLEVQMFGKKSNRSKWHARRDQEQTKFDECLLHSVQGILPSLLLSRNINVKIYKTIILPVFLYGRETLSLTVRKEHRLTVSENRVIWTQKGMK
jgi:hypothetical protein